MSYPIYKIQTEDEWLDEIITLPEEKHGRFLRLYRMAAFGERFWNLQYGNWFMQMLYRWLLDR
jgi:hypothetical protein